MSALAWMESTGVAVSLTLGGGLEVDGLERLDDALYIRVLAVARTRKAEIVAELRERARPPVLPDDAPEEPKPRRKWMTRERVASFKKARPWLLEHLAALLAAGWTRDELFRVRRPLGHPYAWGVAWGSGWREAEHVELQPNGWIAFHQRQHDGRVNVLHSWPGSYRHGR